MSEILIVEQLEAVLELSLQQYQGGGRELEGSGFVVSNPCLLPSFY